MKLTIYSTFLYVVTITTGIAQEASDTLSKSPSWVAYPAIGYQPETGFQFGAIAVGVLSSMDGSQTEFVRQSSFTPFFVYTTKNQILTACNVDYYFSNGTNLNVTPRFFKFPDKFFGIGNATDPEVFEDYTTRFWRLEGLLLVPKTPKFFIGGSMDFQSVKFLEKQSGGVLETNSVVGSTGGTLFSIGPAVRYDSRDNVIYPSKGYLINSGATFTQLGDFGYSSYVLHVRRYFSIKEDRDVLAMQLSGLFNSGSDIPFFKMPQLGGDSQLRGIANASLYRDRQTVFGQVEYRKHLFWLVGAVAFVGAGDVANELGDLSISEFKYVGGIGFRFQVVPDQKLNLRFDYGLANGGQSAFYVGMREAF